MNRVVVFLLVPALIAMSGVIPALHTHAYDDHDHPEHHHAPAAHHHATPVDRGDGAARLEDCDPGAHAVPVAFVCAAPSRMHVVAAVLTVPRTAVPEIRLDGTVAHADVRVHGPPPPAGTAPRAPPLIAHA